MSTGHGPARHEYAPAVAAVLLLVTAALAVAGTFGGFAVYTYTRRGQESSAVFGGWGYRSVGALDLRYTPVGALQGIPLTVAAAVALLAAAMLLRGRAADGRLSGRATGIAATTLLIGIIASIWTELASQYADMAVRIKTDTSSSSYGYGFLFGPGTWTELAAGVVAVVGLCVLIAIRDVSVRPVTPATPVRPAVVGPLPPAEPSGPWG